VLTKLGLDGYFDQGRDVHPMLTRKRGRQDGSIVIEDGGMQGSDSLKQ